MPIEEYGTMTINLKIVFSGSMPTDIDKDAFEREFNYVLANYDDGRYPFESEMIRDGMHRVAMSALGELLFKQAQATMPMTPSETWKDGLNPWYQHARDVSRRCYIGVSQLGPNE